jgi:tRNA 2-thiouridine synthesizing protein A
MESPALIRLPPPRGPAMQRECGFTATPLPDSTPIPTMECMSETLLDVKGMNCPLPVLRANRALRSMAPGEKLRVLATDRAAIADFRAFCQETGHALIAMSDEAGVLSFVIRRRADPKDT